MILCPYLYHMKFRMVETQQSDISWVSIHSLESSRLGIFDDIGNDDDGPLLPSRDRRRELEGMALLRAERANASALLVQLGVFAAELTHLGPALGEAWALLNLDRIMRRILAAASLEPSDILPHLVGGAPLPFGLGADAANARFLLCALLPVVADRAGTDGVMAERLLRRLRPARIEDRDTELWADEQLAIDEVSGIARKIARLIDERMAKTDAIFAITDFMASYGAALHGFPFDHLPDNEGARQGEIMLETYRSAAALPPLLSRARSAVPEDALISVFDLGAAVALAGRLAPMPLLSGIIRRDLFRRDLHYPADLGSLIAALKASLAASTRDRDTVVATAAGAARSPARVQQVSLAALSCFGSLRPSALATLTGSSWQGVETALQPLRKTGRVSKDGPFWHAASDR